MTRQNTDAERELLRRADLTIQNLLDDGGLLPPEIAETFYRKIMDVTTIFNQIRTIPMSRPEMRIPTIASNGRMLRVARNMYTAVKNSDTTGTNPGDYANAGTPNRNLSKAERSTFTTGIIDLKTDELIAGVYLTYELLEDITQGGSLDNNGFQSLVLDLIAQQVQLDLEEKLVLGDTGSGDDFLALQDGLIKWVTSNIVNQNGAPINHLLFAQMIKALPVKYRSRLATYKFFVNNNVEIDYRAQLAQRQTAMGDGMLTGTAPVVILGVPMVRAGFLPADTIILTDPRNILFGIYRKFRLATVPDEENRLIKIILTIRCGQNVEQEDMMVKAINVGSFI